MAEKAASVNVSSVEVGTSAGSTSASTSANTSAKAADRLAEIALRRAELELAELEERKVQKEEVLAASLRARESSLKSWKERITSTEKAQKFCTHRKPAPSRDTYIAGQRDHRGHTIFLCQLCQKSFEQGQVPLDLLPSSDIIGGPIIGSVV
jgi:CO/xanthine dehydrogenase Mo-binding subunit